MIKLHNFIAPESSVLSVPSARKAENTLLLIHVAFQIKDIEWRFEW